MGLNRAPIVISMVEKLPHRVGLEIVPVQRGDPGMLEKLDAVTNQ